MHSGLSLSAIPRYVLINLQITAEKRYGRKRNKSSWLQITCVLGWLARLPVKSLKSALHRANEIYAELSEPHCVKPFFYAPSKCFEKPQRFESWFSFSLQVTWGQGPTKSGGPLEVWNKLDQGSNKLLRLLFSCHLKTELEQTSETYFLNHLDDR
jgi:hypothetical protein